MSYASRREFVAIATAATSTLLFPAARASQGKKFEGIFAIPQSPFTESGAFDVETLGDEIRFLHRCGVQGIVWPVNASEQSLLTQDERLAGAEAIIRANNKADAAVRPTVVIGVQAADGEAAAKYAQHAEKAGTDAILAIPYKNGISDDAHQMEYYSAIGAASTKPLFVQAIGNLSVDLILSMAKKIPTLRYVKDEAGTTLQRLNEYRSKEHILDGVFTGKSGPTFLDELARGAVGQVPGAACPDLYVATWKAWKAGNQRSAQEMFSKVLLLMVQGQNYGMPAQKYILQARGVFKNTVCRVKITPQQTFDADARKAIDQTLAYLKPWLKA